MLKALWSIIGLLVLVHGYFFIRYYTPHPCVAAMQAALEYLDAVKAKHGKKIANDLSERTPRFLFGEVSIATCYMVALTGRVHAYPFSSGWRGALC